MIYHVSSKGSDRSNGTEQFRFQPIHHVANLAYSRGWEWGDRNAGTRVSLQDHIWS